MNRALVLLLLAFATVCSAAGRRAPAVVCAIAPSQSGLVAAMSAAAGDPGAAPIAVMATASLAAETRGDGALVLVERPGFVIGPIRSAVAGPRIVGANVSVGGAIVTVELVCAADNHPEQVARVRRAAQEFSRRFASAMARRTLAVGDDRMEVTAMFDDGALGRRRVSTDVWAHANRPNVPLRKGLRL